MRRPAVSTFGHLRGVARRFCPPYEIADEAERGLRISLRDPDGQRPPIAVRHRHERRVLLKANYLFVESKVPGDGPSEDGELVFRFRGSLRRQRSSFRWKDPVADGGEWSRFLEAPLMGGVHRIKAIESLRIGWSVHEKAWHLQLKTLSGAMVGGFMSPLPIPVPMDRDEALGIVSLIDVLVATAT
jgi:hypothetical protein